MPGESVAVAVSGGLDSTVLLHLLHRTQGAHRGELVVCSIDHGLRPESAHEVEGVGALARNLSLPFRAIKLEIEPGPNLAERARDARRLALESLGTACIATGHHEDDQAETVLFHLLRGSGMRGLQGMQIKNGPWVRPLLFESREALHAWAMQEALTWVEDPSNPGSQRGTLRGLMPRLDEIHGGAGRALSRSARLLAREDEWLSSLADAAWEELHSERGLNREMLALLHPALQLRLLRRLVPDGSIRAEPLESVVDGALSGPGTLDLGRGITLVWSSGHLRVET